MRPNALIIASLAVALAGEATAETFVPRAYRPEAGVERLTRDVARNKLDRDLFGTPWATVVMGNIDVYEGFPYLESRRFQVVSDPEWDRLLLGETDGGLASFDGTGSAAGRLKGPRGLAVDDRGRIYVADTGNDRVVVYRAITEFDEITLETEQVIDGLAAPWDVAVSDGGTPFTPGDDRLYVANSGANEIRRYVAAADGWRAGGALGELGSGPGRLAGPLALAVGHTEGAATGDVYVADNHNRRVVQLADDGDGLRWVRAWPHDLGVVTSVSSDHWGNLYLVATHAGGVVKTDKSLVPLASLVSDVRRPRSFHVPFVTVRDHRTGSVTRSGEGSGVLVDQWDGDSGLRAVDLGVELREAAVVDAEQVRVDLQITDHAAVTVEIRDPRRGDVVARHESSLLEPGARSLVFTPEDHLRSWDAGTYQVRVQAVSTYDAARKDEIVLSTELSGDLGSDVPRRLELQGNHPNPFNPVTAIRFSVPAGGLSNHLLRVYDARGRLVRELGRGPVASGRHEVVWDGRDASGAAVSSGTYLYRLQAGESTLTGKMVLLK